MQINQEKAARLAALVIKQRELMAEGNDAAFPQFNEVMDLMETLAQEILDFPVPSRAYPEGVEIVQISCN